MYVQYSFMFMFVSVFGFYSFYSESRTFIWQTDGLGTYFPGMHYSGRLFREWILHFFSGNFSFPTWDFSLALGMDVFQTMHTPNLDILFLLNVFVPSRYTEQLYNFIVIARLYLAGIAFVYFCGYMKLKHYAPLGAISYVFSGWVFLAISHHFFLIPLFYLPVIILGLEKILAGERPILFIISVALLTINSYYFLYKISIFFFPYILIRIHRLYSKRYFIKLIQLGFILFISFMIALFISSFILLPQLYFLLTDSRVGHINIDNFWIRTAPEYLYLFMNSIASNVAATSRVVYPAILLFALLGLVFVNNKDLNHDKWHVLGIFAILLFIYLVPAGDVLMNGFSYASARWMFIFAFYCSFVIVKLMPYIFEMKEKMFIACFLLTLFYGYVAVFIFDFTQHFILAFAMMSLTLGVLCYTPISDTSCKIKTTIFFLLIAVNISANVHQVLGIEGGRSSAQYVVKGEAENHFWHIPIDLRYSGDTFRRLSLSHRSWRAQHNAAIVRDYFSISSFWSIQNPNDSALRSLLELNSQYSMAFRIRGFNEQSILNALTSTRYFIVTDPRVLNYIRPPYGHLELNNVKDIDPNITVFINMNYLPFGFTYSQSISEYIFRKLDTVSRQEILLSHVVLNKSTNEILPNLLTTSLPFTIEDTQNVTWEEGLLHVHRRGGELTLTFEGLVYSEIYVRLSGFGSNRGNLTVTYSGDVVHLNQPKVSWRSWSFSPINHENYTVHLGFSESSQTSVTLTFGNTGTFYLQNIEVFALPKHNFQNQVEELSVYYLQNLNLHTREGGLPGLTNRITGDITLTSPRYLFFSIPFSSGWRAYVNGKQVEVLQANIAFMALDLPAGHHEIELRYRTPGMRLGIFLSILGFIGLFFIVRFYHQITVKFIGERSN